MLTDDYITGWRGACVTMGLGHPYQRAVCGASLLTGTGMYALKYPQRAFRGNNCNQ